MSVAFLLLVFVIIIIATYACVIYFAMMTDTNNCNITFAHLPSQRATMLPVGWFNPSCTGDGKTITARWYSTHGNIFTYRYGLLSEGMNARLLCQFEPDGKRRENTTRNAIMSNGYYVSDVRPFVYKDRLFGLTSHCLLSSYAIEKAVLFDFETGKINPLNYESPNKRDKNWTPLTYKDDDIWAYTDATKEELTFRKLSIDTLEVTDTKTVQIVTYPQSLVNFSTLRGGSNWIEVRDGVFWSIMHCTGPREPLVKLYRSVLVEVDWANGTAKCSKFICFSPDKTHPSIQFVSGMYRRDNNIIGICVGIKDRYGYIIEYLQKDLENLLIPSPQPSI